MFKPVRDKKDRVIPKGMYKNLEQRLKERNDVKGIRTVTVYPFDRYTDLGPYVGLADRLISGGILHYTACLVNSGFTNLRAVLRQHNPKLKLSKSKLNGQPIDQVEISSMSIHSNDVWDIIKDAYQMPNRPLITLGGPAGKYEPHMFFGTKEDPTIGIDVAITGEAYTGIVLKERILNRRKKLSNGRTISMREAFEDLAQKRELDDIHGIAYRWIDPQGKTWIVDTYINKGVEDLSEYPTIDKTFKFLEKKHNDESLKDRPATPKEIANEINLSTTINTGGCRLGCDYCPITNGELGIFRTSGFDHLGKTMEKIFSKFGIKRFFGADDNIGNDINQLYKDAKGLSQYIMEDGSKLIGKVESGSEITLTDLDKFARKYPDGLMELGKIYSGLWMGNEDVNQELVKKGQSLDKVRERLHEMINAGISPMIMNIYGDQMHYNRIRSNTNEEQHQSKEFLDSLSQKQKKLFRESEMAMDKGKEKKSDILDRKFVNSLTPSQEDKFKFGLREESFFYLKYGAVSQQFTLLTPAVGTEVYDIPYNERMVFDKVGDIQIEQHHFDGNHVVMTSHNNPVERLKDVYKAYGHMYNYSNLFRAVGRVIKEKFLGNENKLRVAKYAAYYQFKGINGLKVTKKRQKEFVNALKIGPIVRAKEPPKSYHPVLAIHPESAKYYSVTSSHVALDPKPLTKQGVLTIEALEKICQGEFEIYPTPIARYDQLPTYSQAHESIEGYRKHADTLYEQFSIKLRELTSSGREGLNQSKETLTHLGQDFIIHAEKLYHKLHNNLRGGANNSLNQLKEKIQIDMHK